MGCKQFTCKINLHFTQDCRRWEQPTNWSQLHGAECCSNLDSLLPDQEIKFVLWTWKIISAFT